MPNGRQLKQYQPKGVTNELSSFDSSSRGSCQNPPLASSLVKRLFPSLANFPRLTASDGFIAGLPCLTELYQHRV